MTEFKESKEIEQARKDMYIFGLNETFEYGEIKHLTFEEYFKDSNLIGLMSLNVLHIYYQYYKAYEKDNKLNEEVLEFLEKIQQTDLLELVNSPIGHELQLKSAYYQIFEKLIVVDEEDVTLYDELYEDIYGKLPSYDEKGNYIPMKDDDGENVPQPSLKLMVIYKLFTDKDLFLKVRKIIMDMNVITEERITKNPEINYYLEMSKKTKKADGNSENFVDILTSIVAVTGIDYDVVRKWNLHQVYGTFQRIAAIKQYDASIIFASVGSDAKIDNWSKHINLFSEEETGKRKSEFKKGLEGVV